MHAERVSCTRGGRPYCFGGHTTPSQTCRHAPYLNSSASKTIRLSAHRSSAEIPIVDFVPSVQLHHLFFLTPLCRHVPPPHRRPLEASHPPMHPIPLHRLPPNSITRLRRPPSASLPTRPTSSPTSADRSDFLPPKPYSRSARSHRAYRTGRSGGRAGGELDLPWSEMG
jgi:hypothetical protein